MLRNVPDILGLCFVAPIEKRKVPDNLSAIDL